MGQVSREEYAEKVGEMLNDMDDEELIGYCEIHSLTELALFNGKQIGRLLKLAGDPHGNADEWLRNPDVWRSADLRSLCVAARKNLREDSQQM